MHAHVHEFASTQYRTHQLPYPASPNLIHPVCPIRRDELIGVCASRFPPLHRGTSPPRMSGSFLDSRGEKEREREPIGRLSSSTKTGKAARLIGHETFISALYGIFMAELEIKPTAASRWRLDHSRTRFSNFFLVVSDFSSLVKHALSALWGLRRCVATAIGDAIMRGRSYSDIGITEAKLIL